MIVQQSGVLCLGCNSASTETEELLNMGKRTLRSRAERIHINLCFRSAVLPNVKSCLRVLPRPVGRRNASLPQKGKALFLLMGKDPP